MTVGTHMAFAVAADEHGDNGADGLTKREYFAACALQGMASNPSVIHRDMSVEEIWQLFARSAVSQADALIAALNGVKP